MKKKQLAFTLIELLIVVAIMGILAAIAIPAYQGRHPTGSNGTYCQGGYLFVQDSYRGGYGRQLIGANGGGIPCQ